MKPRGLRDVPFNPERRASTPASKEWVAKALGKIKAFELERSLRRRNRKPADQQIFDLQVEALLCDLAHSMLFKAKGRSGRLSLSLSKQRVGPKQNGHRLINSTLTKTLSLLSDDGVGLISLEKGSKQSGKQTTVGLSKKLASQIRRLDLRLSDFALARERQPIELRASKVEGTKGRLVPLDLSDPDVCRMIGEVNLINTTFASADIEYHGIDSSIDERERSVYRVFNDGSLRRNGLLYGGFWSRLRNIERLRDIFIDQESIVELDLKSSALQIAYALTGSSIDSFDLYLVPGLEGLPRDDVKKMTLTYLNGGREAFRFPLRKEIYRKLCPQEDESLERVRTRALQRIRDHHSVIKEFFDPLKAGDLQYVQAEIICKTVFLLASSGIVALPVGDAIYVKKSALDLAKAYFEEAFKFLTGGSAQISISKYKDQGL